MVTHVFNTNTWETVVDRSLWVISQPGLQNEFQDSQSYTEKPYLNTSPTEIIIFKEQNILKIK